MHSSLSIHNSPLSWSKDVLRKAANFCWLWGNLSKYMNKIFSPESKGFGWENRVWNPSVRAINFLPWLPVFPRCFWWFWSDFPTSFSCSASVRFRWSRRGSGGCWQCSPFSSRKLSFLAMADDCLKLISSLKLHFLETFFCRFHCLRSKIGNSHVIA